MAQHNDTGNWGEELAVRYLRSKGYTIRDRNWRSGHRELDVVALSEDMSTIVFVEVKTRDSDDVTLPEQAVDRRKIRSIGYVANSYIKQNNLVLDTRFDIITIIGNEDDGSLRVEHLEDAFNPMLAY